MTKDRILNLAREQQGFVLGRNTQERTVRLVSEMIGDKQLRIKERFANGDGCRVVPAWLTKPTTAN